MIIGNEESVASAKKAVLAKMQAKEGGKPRGARASRWWWNKAFVHNFGLHAKYITMIANILPLNHIIVHFRGVVLFLPDGVPTCYKSKLKAMLLTKNCYKSKQKNVLQIKFLNYLLLDVYSMEQHQTTLAQTLLQNSLHFSKTCLKFFWFCNFKNFETSPKTKTRKIPIW